jgi:hypothetical protein
MHSLQLNRHAEGSNKCIRKQLVSTSLIQHTLLDNWIEGLSDSSCSFPRHPTGYVSLELQRLPPIANADGVGIFLSLLEQHHFRSKSSLHRNFQLLYRQPSIDAGFLPLLASLTRLLSPSDARLQ